MVVTKTAGRHLQVAQRTVVIGRIRKDASLYSLPPEYCGNGRRRKYGEKFPTPEQVRADPEIRWKTGNLWAAGKEHEVRYKEVGPLLWKSGVFPLKQKGTT